MFARCARVEPAIMSASRPPLAFSTFRTFASCTTFTCLLLSVRLSVPLPPFTVTASVLIVAVTPCGKGTGCLATRDMSVSSVLGPSLAASGNDADHFAAVARGARGTVGHHAFRRGHDRDAQAAEDRRKLVLALVDTQAGTADALEPVDDRSALVILELHGQRRLAVVRARGEVLDVALFLQNLRDRKLHLGSRHVDL